MTDEKKSQENTEESSVAEQPQLTDEAKRIAMFCHLLGIIGVLGPLVMWVLGKDKDQFIDQQGKEALNFQLTVLICLGVLFYSVVGMPFIPALIIVNVILVVLAGIKASDGKPYRYPVALRLIK